MKKNYILVTLSIIITLYCSTLTAQPCGPACITGYKDSLVYHPGSSTFLFGRSFTYPYVSLTINGSNAYKPQSPIWVKLGGTCTVIGNDGLVSYCYRYFGQTSLNSVRAGWVNDESATSTTFYQLSYFDSLFTSASQSWTNDWAFTDVIQMPAMNGAHNHQYLKLQVTMSTTSGGSSPSSCDNWFRTYIIKIPLETQLQGDTKFMEVATTPQTKDFNVYYGITPQEGVANNKFLEACYNNSKSSCKVSDFCGCWGISNPQNLTSNNINLYSTDYDSNINADEHQTSIDILNVPQSCYIKTRFYPAISSAIRAYEDSLNDREVNAADAFAKTSLGGISELLTQIILGATGYNLSNALKFPLLSKFDPSNTSSLVTGYDNIIKPYQDIPTGINDDSLRAQLLVRLLYSMQAETMLYNNDVESMSKETGSMAFELFKLTPMWSAIQKVFNSGAKTQVITNGPEQQIINKAVLKLTLNGLKFSSVLVDYVTQYYAKLSKNAKTANEVQYIMGNIFKSINGVFNALQAAEDKGLTPTNQQTFFLTLQNLFTEDAFKAVFRLIAMEATANYYVYDASSYLNSATTNWCLNEQYYNATNAQKSYNDTAYYKTNCYPACNSILTAIHNQVKNTVATSSQDRDINSGLSALQNANKGAMSLSLNQTFETLDEFLKPLKTINLGALLPVFLYDVKQTLNIFFTEAAIPVQSFYAHQTVVPDIFNVNNVLYVYNSYQLPATSSQLPITSKLEYPRRLTSVYDNLQTQISNISTEIINKTDTAQINAGLWNTGHSSIDSTNINNNILSLLSTVDSVIAINSLVNAHVCSANDSLVSLDSTFGNNYMQTIGNNYYYVLQLVSYCNYLIHIKYNTGTMDSLTLYADSVITAFTNYKTTMSNLVTEFTNIPPKPYILIQNVTVTPDSIGTNIPFKLKATVFNFGTSPIDSITVTFSPDPITHLLTKDTVILIATLPPNSGQNLEWDMVASDSSESFGYYSIEAKSNQTYYQTQGNFGINIAPRTKYGISGQVLYDNPNAPQNPLTNTKLILKTVEGVKVDSTTSDSLGNFTFYGKAIGKYFLVPYITKTPGGFNSIDALLVNRYVVKLYSITDPLKLKAADVKGNNKINSIDALLINRRYLKLITTFPEGNWLYAMDTLSITNDDIKYNLKSISVGDVNGSYFPPK